MPETTFQYSPLVGSRTVRLLKFVPDDSEAVACVLLHVDIDEAPPYVAISYTWGHPNDCTRIKAGGESIEVSRNLEEPLAYHQAKHPDIYLWADSICINQRDVRERSSQIRLMKSIFEKAKWISAWLGPATPETDLAIEKVGEWHLYVEHLKKFHNFESKAVIEAISQKSDILWGPPCSPAYDVWSAIQHLCQRSWWSRAWIIQEATTPKAVRIHCGTVRFVEFEAFASINVIVRALEEIPGLHAIKNFDRGESNQLLSLQLDRIRKTSPTFLQLLQLFRRLKADIVTDYSRTVEDVYLDVAKYVLENYPEGHRLDFLGYIIRSEGLSKDLDLSEALTASWIPDWRVRIVGDTAPNRFHQDCGLKEAKHDIGLGLGLAYCASGGLPTCAAISGRTLTVSGLCIDSVSEIILVSGDYQYLRDVHGNWLQNLESLYPTGEPNWLAIKLTWVEDMVRSMMSFYRKRQMDWSSAYEKGPSGRIGPIEEGPKSLDHKLFWTQKGYVGIGSPAVKVGDRILILFGGQVPYILRPREESSENEMEFIGECYVHGLMFGEALQFKGKEGVTKSWNIV